METRFVQSGVPGAELGSYENELADRFNTFVTCLKNRTAGRRLI